MKLAFRHSIALVCNLEKSTHFYKELLGLTVDQAYDTIVIFKEGFAIHDAKLYTGYAGRKYKPMEEANVVFYFVTPCIEEVYDRLRENQVSFIHEVQTQVWGEKCMRFYDPDGHIIEIGDAV